MLYTNKVNQEQKKNNILFIVYYNIRIAFTLHCRGSLKKLFENKPFQSPLLLNTPRYFY